MSGAAVVVFGVDGEAEEEDVHHVLKDRQEAVRHQERKSAHDEERQHPHRVVPLVVQGQHAAERRAGDDEHLRAQTAESEVKSGPAARELPAFGVRWVPGTFPRKRTKSPTVLMAVTRRAFSTRMMKASRAEVQKLVLLIAVAV